MNKIQFVATAIKWRDKTNGNTYHSVKITRVSDGITLYSPSICYGYGEQYRQTALSLMRRAGWLPEKYSEKLPSGGFNDYAFERDHNYPILWNVSAGLKRDMLNNVKH